MDSEDIIWLSDVARSMRGYGTSRAERKQDKIWFDLFKLDVERQIAERAHAQAAT